MGFLTIWGDFASSELTMSDWKELVQSVFIGLIFSFLVAKLIAIVISFRDENLSVVRASEEDLTEAESNSTRIREKSISESAVGPSSGLAEKNSRVDEEEDVVHEEDNASSITDDDDDDWEGVESTELDEAFSAATAFVAAAAADRLSVRVSNDIQLQLYGLYKIATEGPCTVPQPSALKMTARAKWQAWQKLGAMPPEVAMEKYINIVTQLYPNWAAGSVTKSRGGDGGAPSTESKGPMGPVFSTFVNEEECGNELKMDAIHAFAREGEVENLLKCIENGVDVNLRDSEGRTPLHWAVDRGHLNVAELLVRKNADVNVKDNDGQTPLHYAVVCEREAIAKFLVKQNADVGIKDNEGDSPSNICGSNWSWMQPLDKLN